MNQTNIGTKKNMRLRISSLDSLRTIGVMMILLFHLTHIVDFPDILTIVHLTFAIGVQLFFIISAFSIYYGYFDSFSKKGGIRKFLVRRFFRIAPLFYLIIVIWGIMFYFGGAGYSITEYLLNITFLFNFFPTAYSSIVSAGWAIGVLFLFYLLVPILITYIRRIWTALVLLIASLFLSNYFNSLIGSLSGSTAYFDFASKTIITQLPFFMMGILLFLLIRGVLAKSNHNNGFSVNQRISPKFLETKMKKISYKLPNTRFERVFKNILKVFIQRIENIIGLGLIILSTFLIIIIVGNSPLLLLLLNMIDIRVRYYAWGIAFCCLIAGFILYPSRIYVNRITKFISDRSYGIYLFHPLVMFTLIPLYPVIYGSLNNIPIAFLVSFLLTFIITIVLASISYNFVEKPVLIYGEKLFLKNR